MKSIKNFFARIKEFWDKGTKQKIIIVVVCMFIIGAITSMGGKNVSSSNDTKVEEKKTTKAKTDKKALRVHHIDATYDGKTDAGVVLNNDSKFIVRVTYDDGSVKSAGSWDIPKPVTLVADQTSTVTVVYGKFTCDVQVKCTTVSEAAYKAQCKEFSYDELARNGNAHKYEYIKAKGKIIQISEDGNNITMRIEVTQGSYGIWDDVVMVGYSYKPNETRFLEDDIVTFYGDCRGLYTYESVLGASITVPSAHAEYIDR